MSEFEKTPKDDAREVDDASHERIAFYCKSLILQILTVVQPADSAEFTCALETIGGLIQDKN